MRSNTADVFAGSWVSSCRQVGHLTTGELCLSTSGTPGKAGLKGNLHMTSQGIRMVYFFWFVSVRSPLQTLPSALSLRVPQKIGTAALGRPRLQNDPACDIHHSLSAFSEYILCPWAVSGKRLTASGKLTPSFLLTLCCPVWWSGIFI